MNIQITDLIAFYAAIVATISVSWQIFSEINDRVKIKVTLSFVSFVNGHPMKYPKDRYIGIKAANIGKRPATIMGAGFRISNKNDLAIIPGPDEIPRRLEEGESQDIFSDIESLQSYFEKNPTQVVKFAWVRDASGKIYKSNIPQNIKKLLKSKP